MKKVVVEDNGYFTRFDAEKTITLSGTVKEFKFAALRAGIILNVVNGEASIRDVDDRDEQPSRSNTVRLDVEDTHARHADHNDDPSVD